MKSFCGIRSLLMGELRKISTLSAALAAFWVGSAMALPSNGALLKVHALELLTLVEDESERQQRPGIEMVEIHLGLRREGGGWERKSVQGYRQLVISKQEIVPNQMIFVEKAFYLPSKFSLSKTKKKKVCLDLRVSLAEEGFLGSKCRGLPFGKGPVGPTNEVLFKIGKNFALRLAFELTPVSIEPYDSDSDDQEGSVLLHFHQWAIKYSKAKKWEEANFVRGVRFAVSESTKEEPTALFGDTTYLKRIEDVNLPFACPHVDRFPKGENEFIGLDDLVVLEPETKEIVIRTDELWHQGPDEDFPADYDEWRMGAAKFAVSLSDLDSSSLSMVENEYGFSFDAYLIQFSNVD